MKNTAWQWKQQSIDLIICWPYTNNRHRQLQKLHFVRWIEEKFSVFVRKRLVLSVGLFPSSLPIVHNLSSAKLRCLSAWCSVCGSHSECLRIPDLTTRPHSFQVSSHGRIKVTSSALCIDIINGFSKDNIF